MAMSQPSASTPIGDGRKSEETTPVRVISSQRITRPAINGRTECAEFKIGRRLKTDQLSVNKGLRIERLTVLPDEAGWVEYKLMARQLAEEEFRPHRPQPTKKTGQLKRRDAVDAEHPDWRSIVAK